jgi:hypothetical protein
MDRSILDWERSLHKSLFEKKKKIPNNQEFFIKILLKFQPVSTKVKLMRIMLNEGLNRESFESVFELLKKKKFLKYNFGNPKGFYIDRTEVMKVDDNLITGLTDDEFQDAVEEWKQKNLE